MAKIPKSLMDRLTDFLVTNIESKALSGITYVMALYSDKELIEKCKAIRVEATEAGFQPNEMFRVYEIKDSGYIFDMDLSVAKFITSKLSEAVSKNRNIEIPNNDIIGDAPERRRREDMTQFAKYCKSQYEQLSKTTSSPVIEVALFSRNSVPNIVINGTDKTSGKQVLLKYNAYAIRHWDIEEVNQAILVPAGLRVSEIRPCEILSSKTGVRFEITIARAR